MHRWQTFHRASSIQDALEALTTAPGPAAPVAGGTDLLLDIEQGRHSPIHTLVDVTDIPDLQALEARPQSLFIGAAVPLSRIVAAPLVLEHAQALVEACDLIGGPQVRNTASLGGNVAHALPAADGTIALMALEAQVEVAALDESGIAQTRRMPIGDCFLGPGKSALDTKRELIVGFHLPWMAPGQASAFKRVMRPQGVALPILNLAAWIRRRGDRIQDVRLAVGPSGPTPRRAVQAEAELRGRAFTRETLERACEALLVESHFRTSPHRASSAYRQELSKILLEDTLHAVWQRAVEKESGYV